MFTVSTRRKVKRKAKSGKIKSAGVVITDNFIALNVETGSEAEDTSRNCDLQK